jgi:ferredoxin, 2Fe-2S
MYTIKVNFEQAGIGSIVLKKARQGQSLLEVLLKNNIGINHKCGGVCACSSCHVYVKSGAQYLEEKSKRETDFIKKAIDPGLNSRLACQCLLLDGGSCIEIILPHQHTIAVK